MYEDISRKMEEKGYKITSQRKSIIETLVRHGDRHLSVEELYDLVKEDSPDVGLTTVYRTVDLLGDMGYIIQLNFGDGRKRFELKNKSLHQHHHLICLECGLVKECNEDLLESLETNIARENNFRIVDHSLKFYGFCADCRNG